MAGLIRGKQTGILGDISAGITPQSFVIDDINRYGINSQVSTVAYDPVQSLLAIGTAETKFGEGQIYVFGHNRVSGVFRLARRASVRILQFCVDKLVCLDSRNDFSVFSLESKKMVSSYSPPGTVLVMCSDPAIDYVMFGMQTGDILAYDLETGRMAPFKIPSFWKEYDPRAKVTPIVSLAFHPRDIGTLLIGYAEGAVVYSFKQNKPLRYYKYEIPRGAPGGDADPRHASTIRHPRLTHAVWHPTGTFILTGHEDGSLVFWDAVKDGRIVMARTLTDTNIDKPSTAYANIGTGHLEAGDKEPLFRIYWCANQDPEDTAILISGGASSTSPAKGLTLLELGRTPNYTTSSWQILSQYLESPRRQRVLPIPPNTEVVDFCLIPRASPHFAGADDPIAMLALLGSGELITMSFPSGFPVSPTNQLHVSATFVHPFITYINLSPVQRVKWLGMTEVRSSGPQILAGGAPAARPMKRFEARNIVQTAHADGTVRLWDAGHGDEIENQSVLEVDVHRAVGKPDGVEATHTSLSGASGELAVGTKSGEVVLFRWGHNRFAGREPPPPGPNTPGQPVDVTSRVDPSLSDGLLPFVLFDMHSGPVTSLKLSDVGFIAAGFASGAVIVVDMRGPAIIFNTNLANEVNRPEKKGFGRQKQADPQRDIATAIEFSVMTLEGENYSSILLHIGTAGGKVVTFKVVPGGSGRYEVQPAGIATVDGPVVRICPMHVETGHPAFATQAAVAGLRGGTRVSGTLLVVTRQGARIFKPPAGKGASKSWDKTVCQAAGVALYEETGGYALVVLGSEGFASAYSIPALREIGSVRVGKYIDTLRLKDAIVSPSGDIMGWTGPAEASLINVFGKGLVLNRSKDALYNPDLMVPPRPTISNIQWISGTQYVTPADIDLLIGGPDRPVSQRMLDQVQASQAPPGATTPGGSQEGYWGYMQRQIQERTEKLGTLSDGVNKLEDASQSWATEASKFVQRTKRNLVMGAVKGKLGI